MFVLSDKGHVYSYKIVETEHKTEMFAKRGPRFTGELVIEKPIHVKELKGIKQMASGQDHILILNDQGQVYAMGDDSFGQCGQGAANRS